MGTLLSAAATEQNVVDAWQRTLDRLPSEPVLTPEVDAFRADLLSNLATISSGLREMTWDPRPLRRVVIPKTGGSRTLHVPTLADRITERAIATVLSRHVDQRLQPDSYAFRPGLGVNDAVGALENRIDAGNPWVARTDIAECFASLSRRGCLRAISDMADDSELVALIERAMNRSPTTNTTTGLAQGSPLSPVVSNIYLDGFDRELWTNGVDILRYGDDIACAASTREHAAEHLEAIRAAAARRGLLLNPSKTSVHDARGGVPFLGATIGVRTDPTSTTHYVDTPRITVHITNKGSALRARGTKFVITAPRQRTVVHAASRTRMIVCNDRTMLTTGALTLAARSGVNVAVIDRYAGLTAFLDPTSERYTVQRAQHRHLDDSALRLDTARRIVDAKIANSVTLLRRTPTRRQLVPLDTAIRLDHLRSAARTATSPSSLLGIEGSAARLYFHGLRALIPEELEFNGRRRRPPTDPVNAMLSYAYTILLAEATRALELASLDPTVGFLHAPHRGRPSLALDLMEEFRTLIVDTTVLRVISTKAITRKGFDVTAEGCRMDQPTKRVLVTELERRLLTRVKHPYQRRPMSYRDCLGEQATLMARIVSQPHTHYSPMPWR